MLMETENLGERDPLEELDAFDSQRSKILDRAKMKLARELDQVCRTYKTLKAHGCKDVLLEPQYYEYMQQLTIPPEQLKKPVSPQQLIARSPQHRGEVKGTIRLILEQASKPLEQSEIHKQVEKFLERKVSPVRTQSGVHGHKERGGERKWRVLAG